VKAQNADPEGSLLASTSLVTANSSSTIVATSNMSR
jgi:hypothetical protein